MNNVLRYRCRDCSGTFLDQLPGIHVQREATERLISYIEVQALHLTSTFTGLASALGVSGWLIRDVFAAHIEKLEHSYVIQTPRYLGIDEIYVEDAVYCVLTDLERHAVVDLLPKRDTAVLSLECLRSTIFATALSTARGDCSVVEQQAVFNRKGNFPMQRQGFLSTGFLEGPVLVATLPLAQLPRFGL